MSLTHCPLCVGLAVLSAVRAGAHLLLLWRWPWPRQSEGAPPPLWQGV